ncbi:MAG TPA: galactokinase [Egibacteraceae bacterium]|nr:galactokinase [Egibacteraceae bacterium]
MTGRRLQAPGRVNLIGEHTDYSGGLVLPAAIDRRVFLEAEPFGDWIDLESQGFSESVRIPADGSQAPGAGWGRYVGAVAAELAAAGRPPIGLRGRLSSDLPAGAGLSSSAALEVVVGLALCAAADFPLAPLELAALAQRAEQRAVGVPSGIMDQAASLLGRAGHALLLDCGTLEHRHIAVPAALSIVVIDSGIARELEHSNYALRRRELEAGLAALDGRRPQDVDPSELDALLAGVEAVPARRVRHVVTENARVRAMVAALETDGDRGEVARLFAEGQASLRDDFEISLPEIDLLVDLAVEAGALGARLTGGGFGGAVVALAASDRAESVAARAVEAYRARTGRAVGALVCRPSAGAGQM